jgi:arginase family enzyme
VLGVDVGQAIRGRVGHQLTPRRGELTEMVKYLKLARIQTGSGLVGAHRACDKAYGANRFGTTMMSTLAVILPFDLFGSPGTGAGAQLVGDALREMLEDNRRERMPARAACYGGQMRLKELTFEKLDDYRVWHKQARKLAKQSLKKGEFLLWVGGNHMSVLPVLEELGAKAGSLCVQFDAHLDVYNLTGCTTEPSHGNFLLHADGPLPPIVHIGHRDLFLPRDAVAKKLHATYPAEQLHVDPRAALRSLALHAKSARRVWIDIDCDVLDPAFFPAVDGPLPFGLTPPLLIRLLDAICSERVAGVSISEFAPARDRNDQSLGLLVWLIEWLILRRYERRCDEEE